MFKAARRIVKKLRQHGHEAYIAGGWVRDFLLGRRSDDIDIATAARPEEVQRIFPKAVPVGAAFGVVLVPYYGRSFEIATFRAEGPYLDGRHPSSVSLADSRQDASRRDFTINGMFYDPVSERVLDYVHGRSDLRRRIVRTIGDPVSRFAEDKLRMMRAIRFACSLNFTIAPETLKAIRQLAREIAQVSWERIRDELLAILTSSGRGRGLELLYDLGILAHILPEVAAMRGVPQPADFHPEGDVYTHTRAALELLRSPSPVLALGTLLHDVGKPPTLTMAERIRFDGHVQTGSEMARQICMRLRMSSHETEQVVDLVNNHLQFMHVREMRQSTRRRFLGKPNFADHLELHRVDCLSSHRNLDNYHFCVEELRRLRNVPLLPRRLISGHDLIAMGFEAGPVFAEILHAVEDQQLEGTLRNREEALAFVRRTYWEKRAPIRVRETE